MNPLDGKGWYNAGGITNVRFVCGYCATSSNAHSGFTFLTPAGAQSREAFVGICNACMRPTFFENGHPTPGMPIGRAISHLPETVEKVWDEARAAARGGAPTAAVMMARSIIAHVAVHKGAGENLSFVAYVNYLADNHHVPEGARGWVDYVRLQGNEVIHDLVLLSDEQCANLLTFTEALLMMTYELPGRMPPPPPPPPAP